MRELGRCHVQHLLRLSKKHKKSERKIREIILWRYNTDSDVERTVSFTPFFIPFSSPSLWRRGLTMWQVSDTLEDQAKEYLLQSSLGTADSVDKKFAHMEEIVSMMAV